MKQTPTPKQALAKLEDLCSRSEHCTFELRQKMSRWRLSADISDRIIARLTATRFVDDLRFAQAYVRDKYLIARWGRNKIKTGLYAKRIPHDIIDQALEEIDPRQYAINAFKIIATKLHNLHNKIEDHYQLRQKLLQFGIARGYETSLVLKIIKSQRLWHSVQQ